MLIICSPAPFLDTKKQADSLFENEFIFALNKPGGIPSSTGKNIPFEKTALALATELCPALEKNKSWSKEFGLLHRLDNETSGILVFAKTQKAFDFYREQWNTGSIRKIYLARVHTPEKALPKKITFPIGHSAKSAKRMVCIDDPKKLKHIRGKPQEAITTVLESKRGKNFLDLTVQITTGVHHQIRCHLATLGAPVLGDTVYETKEQRETKQVRMYLHASGLSLPKII